MTWAVAQRERDFGELDEVISAGVRGEQQVSRQFGPFFRRLPDGLCLLLDEYVLLTV